MESVAPRRAFGLNIRIDAYDAEAATAQSEIVHSVYAAQYQPGPDFAEWRDGVWRRHRARGGFDLLIARDGGEVAGVAWGYVGGRGQYWTDRAAAALPAGVGEAWLGGHFEVVELIVVPACRRRGVAGALLRALLARTASSRALLSVDDTNTAARSLYRSMGWELLGSYGSAMSIMGIDLRRATGQAGSSR